MLNLESLKVKFTIKVGDCDDMSVRVGVLSDFLRSGIKSESRS